MKKCFKFLFLMFGIATLVAPFSNKPLNKTASCDVVSSVELENENEELFPKRMLQSFCDDNGHDFEEPEYVWDGQKCTAKRVCLTDRSHVEIETVVAVYIKDKKATCVKDEQGHYVACFLNPAFEKQQTVDCSVTIPNSRTGHLYGPITYEWSDDHTVCTAKTTCVHCKETLSEKAKDLKVKNGVITAIFANKMFETQKYRVTLPYWVIPVGFVCICAAVLCVWMLVPKKKQK